MGQTPAPKAPAATPAAATQPERFPIATEYMTLFNGLIQNIQSVQKQVQLAEEKLRGDICLERGFAKKVTVNGKTEIDMPECDVNWQAGTVSKRVLAEKAPEKK